MRPAGSVSSRERGAATVVAAGAIGVLASLFLAAALLGSVAVARNHAQTAADLAAVAGAQGLMIGWSEGQVCDRAARFVAGNEARVSRCRLVHGVAGAPAAVLVEVHRPVFTGTPWVARARARAGPVPR